MNDDFATDPSWVLPALHRLSSPAVAVTDLPCRWDQIEPTPGTYNFTACDALYKRELANNIRPMFVLWDAPGWARPMHTGDTVEAYPPDPAYDSNWSAFVAAMVRRYASAAGFEVWNEPNNCQPQQCEWGGQPLDPVRYADLMDEAATAAHNARAGAVIIGGGLAPIPSGTGVYGGDESWQPYFSSMLSACCSNGAPYVKAFAEHDYIAPGPASSVASAVAAQDSWIRSALNGYGLSQPLWMTEGGFWTDESTQSTDVQAMFSQLGTDNVAEAIFQQVWDGSWGGTQPSFGFWRVDGSAKPVVAAMSAILPHHRFWWPG